MPTSPFPQGMTMPDSTRLGRVVRAHDNAFWIHKTRDGRRALIVTDAFVASLDGAVALDLNSFSFAGRPYRFIVSGEALDEVESLPPPSSVDDAIAFSTALGRVSGAISGSIYCSGRLLTFLDEGVTPRSKAEVLGAYVSGGISVPADDIIALQRIVPKIDEDDLERIVAAAGIATKSPTGGTKRRSKKRPESIKPTGKGQPLDRFDLPGRKALSDFFNEHVIDVVTDEERYASLGIGFPGGVVLEGPTGCGKTFAVERLIEHLGWPSFPIEASSIASPYIHETSRKVAEVFAAAVKAAPSIIVIDEMDAFLASREAGAQQHHVEEVAEFLRRIPQASANRVLVIGMTNKVDAIDSAILRRGRFDHVIHVDHAGRDEVSGLLVALLADIPNDIGDLADLADQLAGRPLSDVSFVVREAGRLAARGRKNLIGPTEIAAALSKCPSRDADDQRRIGF